MTTKKSETETMRVTIDDKQTIEKLAREREITAQQCLSDIIEYYRQGRQGKDNALTQSMVPALDKFVKKLAEKTANDKYMLSEIYYNTAPDPEKKVIIINELTEYICRENENAGLPYDKNGIIEDLKTEIAGQDVNNLKEWRNKMKKDFNEKIKIKRKEQIVNIKLKEIEKYATEKIGGDTPPAERDRWLNRLTESENINLVFEEIVNEVDEKVKTKLSFERQSALSRFHEKIRKLYEANGLGEPSYDEKSKWVAKFYDWTLENMEENAERLYQKIENDVKNRTGKV